MEKIGSLAANTTIQVPVRVVVDEKKKQQFIGQYPGFIAKRSNPYVSLLFDEMIQSNYLGVGTHNGSFRGVR